MSQPAESPKWNRDLSQLKDELLALSPLEILSVSGHEWADIMNQERKRLGMPSHISLSNVSRMVIGDWLVRYSLRLMAGHEPDDIVFEKMAVPEINESRTEAAT